MFLQNQDEEVKALFSLGMFNGKIRASGVVTFAKTDSQFQLAPCKSSDDENCYLWIEVDGRTK